MLLPLTQIAIHLSCWSFFNFQNLEQQKLLILISLSRIIMLIFKLMVKLNAYYILLFKIARIICKLILLALKTQVIFNLIHNRRQLRSVQILKQDDQDPNDRVKEKIVFFLKDTNLYFIDVIIQMQRRLVWYTIQDFSIQSVSRGVIAGVSSSLEQKIYLFKKNQENSDIQLFNLDLTLPEIYQSINAVKEINILEWYNFLTDQAFALSVYDFTKQQNYIYWVLVIQDYKIQKVKYKLPNYYSLMLFQTIQSDNKKCINFSNKISYDNEEQYSILCPKYILFNNGYQSDLNDRYSIFIQSKSSIIFIQYSNTDKSIVNIFKQQNNTNSLSLSQYLSNNITCISNPNYVSYRINIKENKNEKIFEVFCKMDQSSYYVVQAGLLQNEIPTSDLMKIFGYSSLGVFIAILIGFIILLLKKRRIQQQIIQDLFVCQQEKKKYVLNQDQFNEKYEILEDKSLGRGTFGSVFECIEKPSKIALMYNKKLKEQKRAVKKIIIRKDIAQEQLQEVYLLDRLQVYPNVIRLINYFYLPDKQLFIILELAQSSLEQEIQERIKEKKHYTKDEILDFCKQIGFLIRDLHNKQAITHRDLKPQNILIANDTYKLSDFGAARQLSLEDFYRQNTHVGSLKWMSPEMREGVEQNNIIQKYKLNYYQCDVFSLGLILMRMVTLEHIDGVNTDEEMKNFKVKRMMEKRKDLGAEFLKVIEDMLIFDLKTRIDMSAFKVRIEAIIKDMLNETQDINCLIEEQDDQNVIVQGGSGVRNVSKGAEEASINTINIFQKKQN
ncbi:kinase domain protein (macronuclear) [Tetrahymena thermophila SB210]|uniref:non-specific serine/threonine protein kinase n=1 Tax=Tetrahymena thermophila (strain SB210) TaxID=312017 RepID=I7M9A2_TETTS|nr:kinase domain protein [Tetrahymena thermophila SB210]EAS01197.2 kinase domain protein [Tetrahymena thermophila SB210]|eukprot:XP_001021442.2 kinase domain protein [Tetrahymena thermophila SB210]